MAARLQPGTRRGTFRLASHLHKTNTADTSFELRFAVHTEHFSTPRVSLCLLFFPLLDLASVNTHPHWKAMCVSEVLTAIFAVPVSFSAVKRFLSRPACTVPLAHTRTPVGLIVHTPAPCTTQTSRRSALVGPHVGSGFSNPPHADFRTVLHKGNSAIMILNVISDASANCLNSHVDDIFQGKRRKCDHEQFVFALVYSCCPSY